MLEYFIVVLQLHISCNLDIIRVFVHKVYTMIVNRSLTMITSCSEVVNLNCVATSLNTE
jgi:hypothetical protein